MCEATFPLECDITRSYITLCSTHTQCTLHTSSMNCRLLMAISCIPRLVHWGCRPKHPWGCRPPFTLQSRYTQRHNTERACRPAKVRREPDNKRFMHDHQGDTCTYVPLGALPHKPHAPLCPIGTTSQHGNAGRCIHCVVCVWMCGCVCMRVCVCECVCVCLYVFVCLYTDVIVYAACMLGRAWSRILQRRFARGLAWGKACALGKHTCVRP